MLEPFYTMIFSNYTYKSGLFASSRWNGIKSPTYHNRKNGKYIGGKIKSKGYMQLGILAKRNPYIWNDSSTWFVNHSYAFSEKFWRIQMRYKSKIMLRRLIVTGGTALKVGYHGPRASTGRI